MKMTRPIKIAVGIFIFFTIIFPFLINSVFMLIINFPFFYPQSIINPENLNVTFPAMSWLSPAVFWLSNLGFVFRVFFIFLAVKNKLLTNTKRILFILGIFFMPHIAMPIYFVAHFWNDNAQDIEVQKLDQQPRNASGFNSETIRWLLIFAIASCEIFNDIPTISFLIPFVDFLPSVLVSVLINEITLKMYDAYIGFSNNEDLFLSWLAMSFYFGVVFALLCSRNKRQIFIGLGLAFAYIAGSIFVVGRFFVAIMN